MKFKIKAISEVFSAKNVNSASNLVVTFRQWLENGKSHVSFGRFGSLNFPSSASDVTLSRVHLLTQDDIKKYNSWGTPTFKRTSDTYLVYAIHPDDPSHYLLMVVIDPNAHQTMNNTNFVITLIKIAKKEFGIKW